MNDDPQRAGRAHRRTEASRRARAKRRRLLIVVHAITFAGHGVLTLGLAGWMGPWGWGAGAAIWALVVARLRVLAHDKKRPRWVTRWVDEPLFAHFGACVVATLLFIPVLGVIALSTGRGQPVFALASSSALSSYAIGWLVSAWSVWGRRRVVRVTRSEIPVPELGEDLDGYRIVHLSDLHVGSYDPPERARQWVRQANALDPDLVAVTGDLVTSGVEFYEGVASVLGELRARDGVYVSLGNHDQWDSSKLTRCLEKSGLIVLRNTACQVRRGASVLNVAGLDDRYSGRDDLDRTLGACGSGPTVLLSHYPDFFEQAARRGVSLVLSGHTHGGQIGLPWAARRFNLARASGQHPAGLSRHGESRLYVHAGLGTTGPPMRLGVAPEIAELVLKSGRRADARKPRVSREIGAGCPTPRRAAG